MSNGASGANPKLDEEFNSVPLYNNVLRSWFVAFGVGGPALFLINKEVNARLVETHKLKLVAALFLLGTGCQVLGATLNKFSNWYVYRGTIDSHYKSSRRYQFHCWFVKQFWVDVVLDIATIALFGVAAWQMLTVFGE